MRHCWKVRADRNPPECEHAKCCYDASCQAVFDYWEFANSDEWKRIVQREFEKEKLKDE